MVAEYPRVLLAAPSSGSGKTTVTCGLLKALLNRKLSCVSFKCGPDYIDPMFHKYVLGVTGGNLDSFFLPDEQVRRQFALGAEGADIAVIEGVMGYYDGLAGISAKASSYDIARITKTPVILVLDCKGASLSLLAVIRGFLDYGEERMIKGVILNRISAEMAKRLTPMIEEMGVAVIGSIAESQVMKLESRHLGLVMPEECGDLRERIEDLAVELEKSLDIGALLEIAKGAPPLETGGDEERQELKFDRPVSIAVARDEAFCFYYQENIRLLENMGAVITEFSPLRDQAVPEGADVILLGGGYPELCARELSENRGMIESLQKAVNSGTFLLAECGGFLYLHDHLEGADGQSYPMAGIIHADAYRTGRLSRFGYIELSGEDGSVKAHEFHYWDSTDPGSCMTAKKPLSARKWECVHRTEHMAAGFPHLYYPSNPQVIKQWMEGCGKEE